MCQHSIVCSGRQAGKMGVEVLSRELAKRLGPPNPVAAAARADLIEQLRIALSGSSDEKFEQLLGKCGRTDGGWVCIVSCLLRCHAQQTHTLGTAVHNRVLF